MSGEFFTARRFVQLCLVTLISSLSSTVFASSSNIFFNNPGSGSTPYCNLCHASTGAASVGSLALVAPFAGDTTLKLGQTYQLTYINSSTSPYAGFNLGDGALVSTFEQIADNLSISSGEISHDYNTADPDYPIGIARNSWTFSWTPNATGASEQFHWCSMSINGDTSTPGDGPVTCSSSTAFSVEANVPPSFATTTLTQVFLETSTPASRIITGVSATDTNAGDTPDTLTYEFDPVTDLSSATAQAPVYQGSGPRTYTVAAFDEINAESSNSVTVNVDIDPIPTAAITDNPTSTSESTSLTLRGITSTDNTDSSTAGTIASYAWTVSRPSNASFATATTEALTFTTPALAPNTSENITATLVVTDSNGQTDSQSVIIQVNDIAVGDSPPVISSLTATTPSNEIATITLTATATDAEDDPLPDSAYAWSRLSGPVVTLSGTGAARSFSYDITDPNALDQAFDFRLVVTDSVNQEAQQDITVTVNNGPTADAGSDDTADEGDTVNISAAGSFDPGGGSLVYAWSQVSGPTVSLASSSSQDTSFTAPDVGRSGDTVVLEVQVTDLGTLVDADQVSISVANVNAAPTADAGPDQSVDENSPAALAGDYTDPDDPGSTIAYAWTQTAGPTVSLSSATSANPTFTTPEVAAGGDDLTFSLIVTDEGLLTSAADTVVISVDNVNRAPTADAGPDQSVDENDTVNLNGSNSDDDDDRLTLGYQWSQLSGPTISLSDSSVVSPSFTAPLIGFDSDPVVALRLTATDSQSLSDTDDVLINITNNNSAPTANAGPDQTVDESTNVTSTVTLDARGSVDVDTAEDDALSFAWSQTGGPVVVLTAGDTSTPTFSAPSVGETGLSLEFEVTVTDRGGLADTDAVLVNVVDISAPPLAAAGPDQDVNEGATVSLSADNSSDFDGNISAFAWRQTNGPAITFSAPNASNTTFVAPRVTDTASIGVQLTVTDNDGLQDTDDLIINILDQSEESPTANAGADQTVAELDLVTLDASASADLDGNLESFLWTQTQGPGVELSDPTQVNPTFTAPVVNTDGAALVFQVEVTDSSTLSATDSTIVNVTNTNQPPIALAGTDQSANEGSTVTLDGSGSNDTFGDALTFSWQQTAGPNIVLSDATATNPTFVAPGISVADTGSIISFELTVTSDGLMASDTTSVTVNDNGITGFDDALPTVPTSTDETIAIDVDNGNLVVLNTVDPLTISETENRPETFYSDLVDIEVTVTTPGDTAVVTILFASPLPADTIWAKYSPTDGWIDFSANVSIASDGLSAAVSLTDGGAGDDDGIANGRIIDPSGPAVFSTPPATVTPPSQPAGQRSSSGGGCSVGSGPADPSLPILLALGVLYFVRRRLGIKAKSE